MRRHMSAGSRTPTASQMPSFQGRPGGITGHFDRPTRSGFTAWGVELARQCDLTLVGRAKGKRFLALSGQERIVFDQSLDYVEEESAKHRRKGSED